MLGQFKRCNETQSISIVDIDSTAIELHPSITRDYEILEKKKVQLTARDGRVKFAHLI